MTSPSNSQFGVELGALEADAKLWESNKAELEKAATAADNLKIDATAFSFAGQAVAASYEKLRAKIAGLLKAGHDEFGSIAATLRASASAYAAGDAEIADRMRGIDEGAGGAQTPPAMLGSGGGTAQVPAGNSSQGSSGNHPMNTENPSADATGETGGAQSPSNSQEAGGGTGQDQGDDKPASDCEQTNDKPSPTPAAGETGGAQPPASDSEEAGSDTAQNPGDDKTDSDCEQTNDEPSPTPAAGETGGAQPPPDDSQEAGGAQSSYNVDVPIGGAAQDPGEGNPQGATADETTNEERSSTGAADETGNTQRSPNGLESGSGTEQNANGTRPESTTGSDARNDERSSSNSTGETEHRVRPRR